MVVPFPRQSDEDGGDGENGKKEVDVHTPNGVVNSCPLARDAVKGAPTRILL